MTSDETDLAALVPKPRADRIDEAETLWSTLLGAPAPLGRLGRATSALCAMQDACPPRPLERVRILSMTPNDVDASEAMRILETAADVADLPLRWLSTTTEASADISAAEALTLGAAAVDREADTGVDLLILTEVGPPSTAAAAVIGLLANRDAAVVTSRPVEPDDDAWMDACAAVREGMRRARDHRGEPVPLLDALPAPAVATLAGALLQASIRRTPVILDGTGPMAAALIAHRLAHRTTRWWWAASASTDPAVTIALDRLDAEPLLLDPIPPGQGVGAVLATQSLRTIVALMSSSGRMVV